MTVGMKTIARINKIQERAEMLGFTFVEEGYGYDTNNRDEIILAVIHEKLPALRDGSHVFSGDLDEVDAFIRGLMWARWYDTVLGLKTDKRREVSEQKLKNRLLLREIKDSEE